MVNTPEGVSADTPDTIRSIVKRAQSGDASAMPALRELLDRIPQLRATLGADIERTVEYFICKMMAENDLAFPEAMKRRLRELRAELEGPTPTPLERLLVDRIVVCWLQMQDADIRSAQAGNCSVGRANYLIRRQDRAHGRFLSAVKALAQVRRLALPALQVNIAEKQVNMSC